MIRLSINNTNILIKKIGYGSHLANDSKVFWGAWVDNNSSPAPDLIVKAFKSEIKTDYDIISLVLARLAEDARKAS